MKKIVILILICFGFLTNNFAQQDTIYFDVNWHKTVKDSAYFYRPIPLTKVGDLYLVKDYHINGNVQMEGYYSNLKKEELEGKAIWYYSSGKRSQVLHYKNAKRNGEALNFSKKGFLRAKGLYKDDNYLSGTFIDDCCFNGYIPKYKAGKKIGQLLFHADSDQIAVKYDFKNDSLVIANHFNTKGENIDSLKSINHQPKDGLLASYNLNNEDDVLSFSHYSHYKNGKDNGEEATYNKQGELLAIGISKNHEPISGTFYRYNSVQNYVNGKLEGPEIGYSDGLRKLTKGVNKDNARWQGQFLEYYENRIYSYNKGVLEGKQTFYFSGDYKTIKAYHHILSNKKEGESAYYNKEGLELAKGLYKDGQPWDGTFFDTGTNIKSSYKKGLKHGLFIQYDRSGQIIAKQEYEDDKLTGQVISSGYFTDKKCECIYKSGNPYSGIVCEKYTILHYKNGAIIKQENYESDYQTNTILFRNATTYNADGLVIGTTNIKHGESYTLTFKDEAPYSGVYIGYNDETITYKKGEKHGPFSKLENDNRYLAINGNYKNGFWDGMITFKDDDLLLQPSDINSKNEYTCSYKKGKPIAGTAVNNKVITRYKNGLKQGLEQTLEYGKLSSDIIKTTAYDKGVPLTDTWHNLLNRQGTDFKGFYKNGKPFNGGFYSKSSVIWSSIYYKNGDITSQIQGYVDYPEVYNDSLTYKFGKPYQGQLITFDNDNIHKHIFNEGKLIKTIVTDDNDIYRVRNTIKYTATGYVITDKDSDLVMGQLTYLNDSKTKAKLVFAPELKEYNGSVTFHNNKITAIDVTFYDGGHQMDYALVNQQLVITAKSKNTMFKIYPTFSHIETFTYKDFLDIENLFVADGIVVMDAYIDNIKMASGVLKDRQMFDGIHIRTYNNTYNYYKMNKGERVDKKVNLSKEALLKILK